MLQVTSREAELAEKLISKQRQCDLLMLEISELAAQLAETNHFDDEGFNSPTDWMRFKCHLSEKAAADRIAVGRMAPKLAESVQALQAGEIGFAHLATMARTVEHVGRHADLDGLLELARKMTPGKFFYECQHYRHSVDAKGYCDDQSDQAVNHHLTLSTAESGHLLINGVLDPVGGAAVRTALEPLAQPSGAHDDRLLRQRFADASVTIDVGRSKRVVSNTLRRALRIRDGHAAGPVVSARRPGAMDITSCTGSMAVRPTSAISSCSVAGTIGWCTRADGS